MPTNMKVAGIHTAHRPNTWVQHRYQEDHRKKIADQVQRRCSQVMPENPSRNCRQSVNGPLPEPANQANYNTEKRQLKH